MHFLNIVPIHLIYRCHLIKLEEGITRGLVARNEKGKMYAGGLHEP